MKTDEQMLDILSDACNKAGSQRAFAKANKVSPSFINAVLKGKKKITPALGKVLGYKKVKNWVKKPK